MSLLAFVALCWFASCSDDDGGSDKPDDVPDVPGDTATVITSIAALPAWEGAEGLETVWTDDDDTFVAFRDDARTTPLVFSRTESGDFESEEKITSPAGTYYVAWREAEDAGAMAIDLTEQDGTWGDGKKYMAATATCTEEGKMDFTFSHLTAVLRFDVTLPETCRGPVLEARLSADGLLTAATADLTASPVQYNEGTAGDIRFDCRENLSAEKQVTFYFHVLPGELSNLCLSLLVDGTARPFYLDEPVTAEAGKVLALEMGYDTPEDELRALLVGNWALTYQAEYYESQERPEDGDSFYCYDPEDYSGLYRILHLDFTTDYATVNDNRSGLYTTGTWEIKDAKTVVIRGTEYEASVKGDELTLKNYWDDPVSTRFIREEVYMRVEHNPVGDEGFELKYTETGL